MHYSVCVPAVLSRIKLEDALRAVSEAGYSHYEIWGWWSYDVDEMFRLQKQYGLSIAALCTRYEGLNVPEKREQYLAGLRETAPVCKKLGCRTVITTVGPEILDMSRQAQHDSVVAGLKACVPILEENDLILTVEPLNVLVDHKGHYLWSAEEVFRIVEEVGNPRVKVLYDLYHQCVTGDMDIQDIVAHIDQIGHFHMAGCPGRHEPFSSGEVDFVPILRAIRDSGYSGAMGLEYLPVQDPVAGLSELQEQLKKV